MASKVIENAVESTQYIEGDTLAKTLAFNGQCFLIQNMYEISRQAATIKGFTGPVGQTTGKNIFGHQQLPHPTELYRDQELASRAAEAAGVTGTMMGGTAPSQFSGYRHVAPVLSNTPGRAATSYSALIRRKNGDKIVEITPDLMALLVPTLRIYKVEYESMLDPEDTTKLVPDLSKDPVEREVIFDDFVDPADLETIFKNRQGRLGGTGIKSFQWDLKGVNPADVDANITAQLNIYFNNVKDIFTDEYGNRQLKAGRKGKASFLDLIIYAPQKKNADLTGLNPNDPLYMLYDGVFFEIKAVVGWAAPPKATTMFPRPDGTTFEDFREAIRHTQTVLFLQLTTHRFDFNQDGTANLIINYRGRYDNKRNSHDIFNLNKETTKSYNELIKEKSEYPDRFKEGTGGKDRLKKATHEMEVHMDTRYNKIINYLIGRLYVAEASALQLGALKKKTDQGGVTGAQGANTEELYKLMSAVQARPSASDPRSTTPRGIGVTSHGDIAGVFMEDNSVGAQSAQKRQAFLDEFFPNDQKKVAVRQFNGIPPEVKFDAERQYLVDAGPQNYIRSTTNQYDRDLEEVDEKKQVTALQASTLVSQATTRRGQYLAKRRKTSWSNKSRALRAMGLEVPFFFLGDLIDVVIEVLLDNQEPAKREEVKKSLQKFITTDIEFFDLKAFYDIGQKMSTQLNARGAPVPDGERGRFTPGTYFKMLKLGRMSLSASQRKRVYRPINIASIPIQFDYFVEWYAQTVAAQRRQFYFLNNFIVDVLTQLVRPSLSAQCFYGIPAQQTHLSMIDFMVNKESLLEKTLFPPATRYTTSVKSIADLEQEKLIPAPCLVPAETSDAPASGPGLYSNFKVITLTTVHPDLLEGNYRADREMGIYHFIVGADRGLLKEATFNRMDAPYLREARIDRNRIAGAEQLRELYNVNLSLYGAPILKPGQLIYVTPSPLGFGDPRSKNSVSRYLGIGGYHMVISVQSVIDSQGYSTKAKALHQAMPARDEIDMDTAYVGGIHLGGLTVA